MRLVFVVFVAHVVYSTYSVHTSVLFIYIYYKLMQNYSFLIENFSYHVRVKRIRLITSSVREVANSSTPKTYVQKSE
jgi:hypothetical protein